MIDRDLTKWKLYAYKNGNFKYLPGTYTMSGRDCWWGHCTFCSWTALFPGQKFRTRTAQMTVEEVDMLVNKYGVREIFDDTGTLPIGAWLHEFCEGIIKRGLHKRVQMGCNMRFNYLSKEDYAVDGQGGFPLHPVRTRVGEPVDAQAPCQEHEDRYDRAGTALVERRGPGSASSRP